MIFPCLHSLPPLAGPAAAHTIHSHCREYKTLKLLSGHSTQRNAQHTAHGMHFLCVQAASEHEARHRERWLQLTDTARTARAAREAAAQAQQARRGALTAALDSDISHLHAAATDLVLCSAKLEAARGLFPQHAQHAARHGGAADLAFAAEAGRAADTRPVHGRDAWRWGPQGAPAAPHAAESAVQSTSGQRTGGAPDGGWRAVASGVELGHEVQRLRAEVDAAVAAAHAAHAHAEAASRRQEVVGAQLRDQDAVAREAAGEMRERNEEVRGAMHALYA